MPVLGEPYGDVLEAGQLQLSLEEGAFYLSYFDRRFPIAPRSYSRILGVRADELQATLSEESPALLEYQSILTAARNLPYSAVTEAEKVVGEAEKIARREAVMAKALMDGKPITEVMGADYEHMLR